MDLTNRVAPGASILVVADNELNRDALSCLLRLHQYDVAGAAEGQEALFLINSRRFDLVVLDIEMPGLNGIELLTQIRATRSQTDLPVIMLTARTHGPDIVEAFNLGANDYLTKLIRYEALAVENKFVLSADEIVVRNDNRVVASPGAQHTFAPLPLSGVIGRRRNVNQDFSAA